MITLQTKYYALYIEAQKCMEEKSLNVSVSV